MCVCVCVLQMNEWMCSWVCWERVLGVSSGWELWEYKRGRAEGLVGYNGQG